VLVNNPGKNPIMDSGFKGFMCEGILSYKNLHPKPYPPMK
ncbi:unnamed protein product, partial [marine sediment metagenome]